jgi:hypothetical protein
MKMLMVCCESGLDEKVVAALEELGVSGYTLCAGATGKGSTGVKRNSAIWPGSNVIVHTCVAEEIIPEFVARVRAARDEYLRTPGCRIFEVPVQQLL